MRTLIVVATFALAACSTASDVARTGPNAYRVKPIAGVSTDAEIKTRGIARANEFCDAQGQRAVITVGQSSGWHLFSVPTAEVRFFCDERLPASAAAKASAP